ncbi:MAG: hypothetical protein LBI48_10330 [Burkholderiaceae bacterium]|nr:hypothetical protein [Burkholderiaceae bacterium]
MSNASSMDPTKATQAPTELSGSETAYAASLVEAAQATAQAVADAAQALDWLETDTFTHALRALEPGHAR